MRNAHESSTSCVALPLLRPLHDKHQEWQLAYHSEHLPIDAQLTCEKLHLHLGTHGQVPYAFLVLRVFFFLSRLIFQGNMLGTTPAGLPGA